MKKLTKLKILTGKFVPKPTVSIKNEKKERQYWYSNPKLLSQSLPKLPFKTGLELLARHKASTPEVWSSFLKILLDRKEYLNVLKVYQDQGIILNQSGLTCVLTAISNLELEENLELAKKAYDSLAVKSAQNHGSMLNVYSKLSKSSDSNAAVMKILNILVNSEPVNDKLDVKTCNNAVMACKAFYSLETMEIASTLFNSQEKPDAQLISTYLGLLSVDAIKNRKEFLSVVSEHYQLESQHFQSNSSTTPIPLKTWTILLYFCLKIKYPLLGISWYNSRFSGEADEILNNALGALYKQANDFPKALELVKDPSRRIRICVDAQHESVPGDYSSLVGEAKEIFKTLDKVPTRTCFDMISMLDRGGTEEDIKMIFDIMKKHKQDLIDKTRDLLEADLANSKKVQSNKELKLRLRLLKIVKAKLEKQQDLTIELDLLKRRLNQVFELCQT